MAVIKAVSSKAGIGQALDYVTKEEKTEDKLVSGLHCEPDTVKDEMQAPRSCGARLVAELISTSFRATTRTSISHQSKPIRTLWSLPRTQKHGKGMKCLLPLI